ncbi:TetR/AcrR family transcriptional regulator [Pseudonocardia spinosispora]|uniref:TetR/AcrR family transcriptional regulator n=1 Tax=Pseudonocardia spinosispora TaxID=103441 RepID=UPI00040AB57B|nr:TetR/AcrR family transcriptional regulator [Pseudonocardia spinosispora]
MTRRTQAQRSDTTTAALVAAGQRLFGRDGYAATSIEAVAAEAGMTKGAAYHHFAGKIGLFRAVFVRQEEELAAELTLVSSAQEDSWSGLRQGCRTFLERCLDQNVRQIVLLDGPAHLGWDVVREIEYQHTLKLLRRGMVAAAADGWIAGGDLTIRCQLVFGALCEAGMLLARSDDPPGALATVTAEAELMLNALRPADRVGP